MTVSPESYLCTGNHSCCSTLLINFSPKNYSESTKYMMETIEVEEYFGTKVPECYGEDDPILCPQADNRCAPDPRGMGVVFFEKMQEYCDNVAQIDPETGDQLTHGEVLLRSVRVAQELQNRGVTTDDVVVLCTYNHMDSCLPFLASLYLGVCVSSLDPTLSTSDSTYLLKLVAPKFVFCGVESEQMMETCLAEAGINNAQIIVFGGTDRNVPFEEFLRSSGSEEEFEPKPVADIFDTAVIFFSSGTTGLPKGICTTHYGLLAQNAYLGFHVDARVCLYFTSLYWISGVMLLTMTILFGGTRVVCRKFDETKTMADVEKYKVTLIFLAPTYTYKLTQDPNSCKYDTSSLACVIVGGGPVGAEQMNKLRRLLPHSVVNNMFGMTEAAGLVTMFNQVTELDLLRAKPTSSGRPVPGICYKIVDPETEKVLGPNQRGELRVKSKCFMNGYQNKPEEYKNAWDSDGYLHTGDIAYYDEDYCFYIVDRIKDLLKYQSWHVVPAEIESIILTHPDVKAAVVVGLPDEVDGDLPLGVIVLKPDVTVTEEDILEFVNERVSDRKKLRGGVKFVESIPLTPSGKLRRRDVRDWVINGLV
ncbi:uncharacterized protein CBL_11137 [Carabus blaptoides fortunei]